MKLRLTAKGYENFTGHMGAVYFENGLSAMDVLPIHAVRIGSTIGAEWENGQSTNPAELLVSNANTSALNSQEASEYDQRMVEAQIDDAIKAEEHLNKVAQLGIVATTDPDAKLPTPESKKYTREELEAIAEEGGLAGLRAVATEVGVKGGSIVVLIERILEVAGA
ncbi:hypothetical protein HN283_13930 [Acinetobacter baumannii]|uniref:hypothetical protein n=1 Tax=Acinetobacter baumannii TaxID=470 RepID=UPI00189BE55B|nr:hypothetical protein [Acinetobacter baumannii]MBF6813622.1 hypothetical protein [Acinetobacter baumannii]MBF6914174.1 hypothetical protein [Acinetobacter baumannii]MBF6974569.1 hypothetical protein [Acinetobacter baumannii]MCJ9258788.1 hypothetical protein [Acinetobacter baumannii]